MTIAETLKDWVATELLEGADVGLDESTELLELGLINSISIVQLQNLASKQFGVDIPLQLLTPQNLATIGSITTLIEGLQKR